MLFNDRNDYNCSAYKYNDKNTENNLSFYINSYTNNHNKIDNYSANDTKATPTITIIPPPPTQLTPTLTTLTPLITTTLGMPEEVVIKNYRRDGSAFWNLIHIMPVSDVYGKVRTYIHYPHLKSLNCTVLP